MKLTMTRVLTPLAALAIAFSAQADLVANEGFEGTALSAGWNFVPAEQGGADDASAITAYGDPASGGLAKPTNEPDAFAGAANNNYLKLSTEDGILFRNLDGAEGVSQSIPDAGLYLDTVVQFTATDPNDAPVPTADDKFVIWLESAGEDTYSLRVCAGLYGFNTDQSGVDLSTVGNGKQVYTLDSISGIAPGSWHRLTVKAIKNAIAADSNKGTMPAFQIYIDGVLATSTTTPWDESLAQGVYGLLPGSAVAINDGLCTYIFPSMVNGSGTLTKVGFSGEGKLDDVVLTAAMPDAIPHNDVTITWAGDELATVKVNGADIAKGGKVRLAPNEVVTIEKSKFSMATGYELAGLTVSDAGVTGDIEATLKSDIYTVTATGTGTSTLTINYTYSEPTYTFTLMWDNAFDEAQDWACMLSSISYKVDDGETKSVLDLDVDPAREVLQVKKGSTVLVTVEYAKGYEAAAWAVGESGVTLNNTTFTIGTDVTADSTLQGIINAQPAQARPFTVGDTAYTLVELNAAIADGSLVTAADNALTFAAGTELAADSIDVPEGKTLYVDLKGEELTAAGTAFTVAGTLNISDSLTGGKIIATTACVALSGDGVCNISGGSFSDDVAGATFAAGYGLVENTESKLFDYAALTYTITYDANGGSGTVPTATTFTVLEAGVIAAAGDGLIAPTGKAFDGWNTAADGSGTAYAAGAATPAVTTDLADTTTLYAQWVDSGKELEPGEQDDTEYDDENAAKEAAAGITVAAAPAVVEALTADGALDAYLGKFEVKTVQKGEKWVNEVALKSDAASALQEQANGDAAAVLDDTATTITTTPGFYYSLKQGTTLDGMTEGERKLATGATLTLSELGLDKSGNAGFYKVLINIAPAAVK